MTLQEIMSLDKAYYMNTFGERTPVCFEYGRGIKLYDTEGAEYTDFFSGIAVSCLGHSHPKLVAALKEQAEKLLHVSSIYYIRQQAQLAQALVECSCADRAFFCSTGAEANEGALKLAKIYFYKKGQPERGEVISIVNSFHGRTLATVAATGQEKYQQPYKPLMPGFKHVPINDMDALLAAVTPQTAAILLEPIQGESGVYPLNKAYLSAIRELCNQKGILLIFDEVQTGMGRTGKMFGYQHYGVEPDIFTLAKGLAGGIPIGAILAKEFVAQGFEPGDHGTTFGGNPFSTNAALTVLKIFKEEGLVENAAQTGAYLLEKLNTLKLSYPIIKEIRGIGLMFGVEFEQDKGSAIQKALFGKKYLTGCVAGKILRLLPPLITTKQDIDRFITTLETCLKEV